MWSPTEASIGTTTFVAQEPSLVTGSVSIGGLVGSSQWIDTLQGPPAPVAAQPAPVTVTVVPVGPLVGVIVMVGASADAAAVATIEAATTTTAAAAARRRRHRARCWSAVGMLPNVPRVQRVVHRLAAAFIFAMVTIPVAAGALSAAPQRELRLVAAEIDGRDLSRADANRPIDLRPGEPAETRLVIENTGDEPLEVRSVRVEGRVLGLSFFSYETVLAMEVARGATEERTYDLDLIGLDGQATGLIPSRLQLIGADRDVLASTSFVADVHGSLRSVYGLFGLAVASFTALTLGAVALALARHRLPTNRFRRALQFLVPGLGAGLTATFTLSALRLVAPGAGIWVPLTAGAGAVFFVFGYLTPGTGGDDDGDDVGDDDDAEPPEELGEYEPAADGAVT